MRKLWFEKAWDDYLYFQGQDKRALKKINDLIRDISPNGYNATGKIEPLKHSKTGLWSARMDSKNRFVFKICDDILEIHECGSHYGDK